MPNKQHQQTPVDESLKGAHESLGHNFQSQKTSAHPIQLNLSTPSGAMLKEDHRSQSQFVPGPFQSPRPAPPPPVDPGLLPSPPTVGQTFAALAGEAADTTRTAEKLIRGSLKENKMNVAEEESKSKALEEKDKPISFEERKKLKDNLKALDEKVRLKKLQENQFLQRPDGTLISATLEERWARDKASVAAHKGSSRDDWDDYILSSRRSRITDSTSVDHKQEVPRNQQYSTYNEQRKMRCDETDQSTVSQSTILEPPRELPRGTRTTSYISQESPSKKEVPRGSKKFSSISLGTTSTNEVPSSIWSSSFAGRTFTSGRRSPSPATTSPMTDQETPSRYEERSRIESLASTAQAGPSKNMKMVDVAASPAASRNMSPRAQSPLNDRISSSTTPATTYGNTDAMIVAASPSTSRDISTGIPKPPNNRPSPHFTQATPFGSTNPSDTVASSSAARDVSPISQIPAKIEVQVPHSQAAPSRNTQVTNVLASSTSNWNFSSEPPLPPPSNSGPSSVFSQVVSSTNTNPSDPTSTPFTRATFPPGSSRRSAATSATPQQRGSLLWLWGPGRSKNTGAADASTTAKNSSAGVETAPPNLAVAEATEDHLGSDPEEDHQPIFQLLIQDCDRVETVLHVPSYNINNRPTVTSLNSRDVKTTLILRPDNFWTHLKDGFRSWALIFLITWMAWMMLELNKEKSSWERANGLTRARIEIDRSPSLILEERLSGDAYAEILKDIDFEELVRLVVTEAVDKRINEQGN